MASFIPKSDLIASNSGSHGEPSATKRKNPDPRNRNRAPLIVCNLADNTPMALQYMVRSKTIAMLVFGFVLILQACSSGSGTSGSNASPKAVEGDNPATQSDRQPEGCDDPDIDLCRRIRDSSGPPAGPGGPLEGKSIEEMKNTLQHCVDLKNRGCL